MLPGFAMSPSVYRSTAALLAERTRVLVPDLYRITGPWRSDDIVARLAATLDTRGLDRVTIIGHSFAGGIELEFATSHLDRIVELVFADTLAMSREFKLAREAVRHPLRLRWLVTPAATRAFFGTVVPHTRQIIEAAWWGFTSGRGGNIERIARSDIPTHVLWANRDSVLSRADGTKFARALNASFDVVDSPGGTPIDHDWMFQEPALFVRHLDKIGLLALQRS
jgi:pimeloyl-ACP methyl ester carboxylesterase